MPASLLKASNVSRLSLRISLSLASLARVAQASPYCLESICWIHSNSLFSFRNSLTSSPLRRDSERSKVESLISLDVASDRSFKILSDSDCPVSLLAAAVSTSSSFLVLVLNSGISTVCSSEPASPIQCSAPRRPRFRCTTRTETCES